MIKKYYANADNTIVNAFKPNLTTRGTGANAGQSDVLETFSIYGREATASAELSRILIKFPIEDISSDRTSALVPASGNVSFYLKMYNAEHSKTAPRDAILTAMAVSQSWQEGIGLDLEGYKDLTLKKSGSNWMSASDSAYWTDINGTLLAGGSYHTATVNNADVKTEIHIFKQTFYSGLENLEINITPLVEQWIDSTYSNYGIGVFFTASQEALVSGTMDSVTKRTPGLPALDDDDTTQSVLYNPSGSTRSYYTKRFFGRGSQYFFKRPVIEARWSDITRDDRGNFYYSSSLAPAADNMNTLYLYNYVRGRLVDIPALGSDKRIYVSIYSGSFNDVVPTSSGLQVLSADNDSFVRSSYLHVVTGGIVSTGIYSASFAFTGSTSLKTIYDVWFTGSMNTANANDATKQFFTGSMLPVILEASQISQRPNHYLSVSNIRQKYHPGETARFDLYVRDKNWSPTIFTKASNNISTKIVQSASYRVYRVLDAFEAIPYGTGSDLHTGLSYDVSGNYFDFDMDLLEPGYAYAFKFSFYDSSLQSWIEQDEAFKFRVEDYEY
tara:strand:- start:3240 stop:4907 length:1668 start_codon:yes stop_codon:yes gene_type:complete